MKTRTGIVVFTAFLFYSVAAFGAQAPVTFTSYSVHIPPATAEDPLTELEYTLGLSSVADELAVNSELMLATLDHGYSHETWFVLEDPFFPDAAVFEVWLDIPPYADVNENGIDDFYDPEAEVNSLVTEGVHGNDSGGAEVFTATWVRGAGETVGAVTFELPYFGLVFFHQFQLTQYKGEYSYTRSGSNLQGTILLTNVLSAEETIEGPLTVEVVSTNALRLSASTWSVGGGFDMVVETNFYDGRFSTNFFSYWVLEDGVPVNGVTDYVDWMMIISSSDANGNGVLDLVESDDGPSVQPTLAIRRTDTGYEVTVTGTVGKTYWLEDTVDVSATAWPDHIVITMTAGTQSFTLPEGAAAMRFFRLVEQ
jgi:hypothetical protein